jgi:hypothetical protein
VHARKSQYGGSVILESMSVTAAELAERTGWTAKPEGLCKGSICVPLPGGVTEPLDAAVVASRLGMPVVHDDAHGLWALGPSTATGRALESAEVPAITLPDIGGAPFDFSSLRGRRAVVVAWASW